MKNLYQKWKKEKKRSLRLDKATIDLTKKFRIAPKPLQWQQIFDTMKAVDVELLALFLQEIRPFAYLLSPFWSRVDAWANHPEITVVKAALQLLGKMPDGVDKSIMTFAKYIGNTPIAIPALSAMQDASNLPHSLLIRILQPTVNEYRRLMSSEGSINERWQEFRLIQTIYKNNGLHLSMPDINLGSF